MAFEPGNQLAKQHKAIRGVLHKLCVQEDWQRVHKMLHSILDKAAEGDMAAATFVADRLDGRVAIEDSEGRQLPDIGLIRLVVVRHEDVNAPYTIEHGTQDAPMLVSANIQSESSPSDKG